jgi:glucose/mannose transport system permease protein
VASAVAPVAAHDPFATGGSRARRGRAKTTVYLLLVAFALVYLVPLAVVVLNSFRSLEEIARTGLLALPRSFSVDHWGAAWSSTCIGGACAGISPFFWNSLRMVVPATIISTAIGAINGYALSKWRFRGSEALFGIVTLGVFLPGQMVLLPWAITLGGLGLTNSTAGLVLIHVVQGVSFTTLFCRNYLVNIPDDLIKAARIDGAGFFRIFWRIVLPLSPPILIVCVIWQFTNIWNEFLFAVTFSSGSGQPITAALIALSASGTTARTYNVESAAVLIAALPPLLVYLFGGRYFMRGLTQGALK